MLPCPSRLRSASGEESTNWSASTLASTSSEIVAGSWRAGDRRHLRDNPLDVGHVRGADDVDPGSAQRLDGGRLATQIVDERDRGLALEHGGQVHVVAVWRHCLEAAERLDRVLPAVGLGEADYDVLALSAYRAAFLEHGVRRAGAGRGAEVDSE